jgi:hypothetical protein
MYYLTVNKCFNKTRLVNISFKECGELTALLVCTVTEKKVVVRFVRITMIWKAL